MRALDKPCTTPPGVLTMMCSRSAQTEGLGHCINAQNQAMHLTPTFTAQGLGLLRYLSSKQAWGTPLAHELGAAMKSACKQEGGSWAGIMHGLRHSE